MFKNEGGFCVNKKTAGFTHTHTHTRERVGGVRFALMMPAWHGGLLAVFYIIRGVGKFEVESFKLKMGVGSG